MTHWVCRTGTAIHAARCAMWEMKASQHPPPFTPIDIDKRTYEAMLLDLEGVIVIEQSHVQSFI